ncbi:hypothetical protein HELRODRAFT_185657 [Helobdella robusta]|uniref:inositol-phosphate phosphatase n=1 Tax=Helobdella robusta TaxID=6412 RepID=T1FN35_HELRO|nr:hypothetical protein HELRODRAFT_185657 [Helobdella robusta]ESO03488.1 hypothetical protein HELRODRAFT_185657 [Helobdella robusta]
MVLLKDTNQLVIQKFFQMIKKTNAAAVNFSSVIHQFFKMLILKHLRFTLLIITILITYTILIFHPNLSKHVYIQNPDIVDSKELLRTCINLAVRAGYFIVRIKDLNNFNQSTIVKGKTKEGADEKMTLADLISHLIITEGLKSSFPLLKLVSEEHDDSNESLNHLLDRTSLSDINQKIVNNDTNYYQNFDTNDDIDDDTDDEKLDSVKGFVNLTDAVAWIDPLDATQEFTENLFNYVTVMICLAVEGRPVIGVVYKPFSEQLYWSYIDSEGRGHLSWHTPEYDGHDRADPTFIISRSHSGNVLAKLNKIFGKRYRHVLAGGAGYKTLAIIDREADAYIHVTAIKKWDICAPDALITASGGKMTTLKGQIINYSSANQVLNRDGLLVTGSNVGGVIIHNKLLEKF